MKQVTISAVLISCLWIQAVHAQSSAPSGPATLRVTGTMLPFEDQKREDVAMATIFVQDKPWYFRIGKVEGLSGEERDQAVKEGALLEQVRFQGPEGVMRRLQKANLVGKLVVIEGKLDSKGRQFLVSSVEEAK